MREFSSGIVGCIICILALMGSVLGGFCLGGESGIRDVTNYDYKTDLTGTFATDNAPEYIDYSPAANFMGYSRNSVDYTRTNTANAYRYVVSYPNDTTINKSIGNSTSYTPVPLYDSSSGLSGRTQVLLNVTDTSYDFGTPVTNEGFTYNVYVHSSENGVAAMKLSTILSKLGATTGIVNVEITNEGNYPVLMLPNVPYRTELTDGTSHWYIYSATISAHPTGLQWNVDTGAVSVYNGSTLLFTSTVNDTQVYCEYSRNTSNGFGVTTVFAKFNAIVKMYKSVDIGSNSDYPPVAVQNVYAYNKDSGSGYPTTPTASLTGFGTEFNMFMSGGGSSGPVRTITKLSNILNEHQPDTQGSITVRIAQGQYKTMVIPDINDTAKWRNYVSDGTGHWTSGKYNNNVDSKYYPTMLFYTKDGSNVVIDGGYSYSKDDVLVGYNIYNPRNNMPIQYGTSSTWTFEWFERKWTSYHSMYDSEYSNDYTLSNVNTMFLAKWNGTQDFGPYLSYQGHTYNVSVPVKPGTAVPYVTTLYAILESMGIEYFNSIDFTVTYGTFPVLFYTGSLNPNLISLGGGHQWLYEITLDDNNMPDRIVVLGGTAQLFKNNVLVATGPIDRVYVINRYATSNGSTTVLKDARMTLNGTATTDVAPVSLTLNNSSSYPSDGYSFTLPASEHPGSPRYMRPLLQYTGTQFRNMGDPVMFPSINKTANIMLSNGEVGDTTYYLTKFSNLLSSIGMATYESVELNITYGTHPIIFIRGSWEYYFSHQSYHDQGGTVHYYYNYYWQSIDDTAFPDKIKIDKATYRVTAYKNGNEIWHANAGDLQVAYKYWTLDDLGAYGAFDKLEVTDQSMSMFGLGKLTPTYGYANPSKGVVLNTPFTTWNNGYKNNQINITLTKQNGANNDMTITAGNASIRLDRNVLTDQMTATVTKHDGTVETRDLGKWHNAQITINASAGTVAFTPIPGTGMPNFTNPVELNENTITWDNWYNGGDIESLTFSTSGKSFRWSVTSTSVFLDTYGIVMTNPSVNVTDYFPEMENWRLNFFSFALLGDSMTVNDITFPVDQTTGRITVVDKDGKTTTADLNNVYVTKENGHTYFNFANESKSIDLGETVNNRVSFTGLWYFTTGLFEVTQGTEKYYDWQIDGQLHATLPQMCLMFIGILIVGLIICKAILRFEIGLIDWVILISATVISLIVAGGNL